MRRKSEEYEELQKEATEELKNVSTVIIVRFSTKIYTNYFFC